MVGAVRGAVPAQCAGLKIRSCTGATDKAGEADSKKRTKGAESQDRKPEKACKSKDGRGKACVSDTGEG